RPPHHRKPATKMATHPHSFQASSLLSTFQRLEAHARVPSCPWVLPQIWPSIPVASLGTVASARTSSRRPGTSQVFQTRRRTDRGWISFVLALLPVCWLAFEMHIPLFRAAAPGFLRFH